MKNKISNIKNTNTGGYSAIGIALGSTLTAANITVANNFIWDVAVMVILQRLLITVMELIY